MVRFFSFLFVILIVGLSIYVWIDRIGICEKVLSKCLGHETVIEDIAFGWEKIKLKNLKIKNAPNPILPFALQADKVILKVKPTAFFKEKIVIDAVSIENLKLGVLLLNKAGTEHNWQLKETACIKKHFQIAHYKIDNLECEAFTCNGKPLKVKGIPHIEFLNLGVKQGMTLLQINNTVFELILMRLSTNPGLEGLVKVAGGREEVRRVTEAKEYFEEIFLKRP